MSKTIRVSVDVVGKPKVEANGFYGDSCKAATKPIEDAISDGSGVDTEDKPEMHQPNLEQEGETENLYI